MGMILNGPWVGWAGDTYLGWMPDPAQAARDILAQYPDAHVVGSAAEWTMPEGLIRITTAEYELVLAQHRVFEGNGPPRTAERQHDHGLSPGLLPSGSKPP